MENKHPILDKWLDNKNKVISKDVEIKDSSVNSNENKQGTAWGRKKNQTWEDKMIELNTQSLKRSRK